MLHFQRKCKAVSHLPQTPVSCSETCSPFCITTCKVAACFCNKPSTVHLMCGEREREKRGTASQLKISHLALKCLDNYLHFEILFSVIPTENLSLIGLIHTVQDLSRVAAIKPITFQLTGCVLASLRCMTTAVPVSAAVHQRFSANQHILKFECLSFLNINRKLYHLATS